jgi:ApaG protein
MIQQINKCIKLSVETNFNGTSYRNNKLYYIFSYTISIENKSIETVKLTDRFWTIYDSLNGTEIVSGAGVVGQTPTLLPDDNYTYKSGCFLESNLGAMKGFYTMINLETYEQFKVYVPTFQLSAPVLLN